MRPLEALARATGYVPLTERLLPARGGPRLAAIVGWAALPFLHLVAVAWLRSASGLQPLAGATALEALQGRVLNAYLAVLTIWAAADVARRLRSIRTDNSTDDSPRRRADARTWLLPPLAIVAFFTTFDLAGQVTDVGATEAATAPVAIVVPTLIAVLIRIPQAVAFWTVVVALLAVARIKHLPGTFPEDRSLGMRPVGELLTSILMIIAAAFAPSFIFGSGRISDLLSTTVLFFLAVGALLLAVWEIHVAMAAARDRAVAAARALYATTYRASMGASPPAGPTMSTVDSLLKGAESIHEWPFDDRMQRIAAVILTGVTTGIVVRLILFGLGI